MIEQVPSDSLSSTPKTDALPQPYYNRADAIYELSRDDLVKWQNHARAQERTIAELTGAFKALRKVISDAVEAWDNDNDSRVGKIIYALDGRVPRYREDTDLIVAASQKAKQL